MHNMAIRSFENDIFHETKSFAEELDSRCGVFVSKARDDSHSSLVIYLYERSLSCRLKWRSIYTRMSSPCKGFWGWAVMYCQCSVSSTGNVKKKRQAATTQVVQWYLLNSLVAWEHHSVGKLKRDNCMQLIAAHLLEAMVFHYWTNIPLPSFM